MRLLFFFVCLGAFLSSCHKDDIITTDPSAKLSFATDSILFDTIFTSVGSVTRRVKVLNNNKDAVIISEIKLEGGTTSAFKLNINGVPSDRLTNVKIAGMDSMLVFVKATINPNSTNTPFIVSDSITFVTNKNVQKIQLSAYGQNARFLDSRLLSQNTVWDKVLPYVIYKELRIAKNTTLQILPGTRIYIHKDAKFIVEGSLQAIGQPGDSITFAGDRKERIYDNEPGQWPGLEFRSTSKDNIITYTTIKNGIVGILIDSASINSKPKVILSNSIVKNMQVAGFVARSSETALFGNLIHNCGQYLFYGEGGGNYAFKQNTMANYNFTFSRQSPSVFLSDFSTPSAGGTSKPLVATFINNIIWGSMDDEIVFSQKGTNPLTITFQTNLFKSKNTSFATGGNLLNTDPQFLNAKDGAYRLTPGSPAINKGTNLTNDPYYINYLAKDIKGVNRLFPSELGAYEF